MAELLTTKETLVALDNIIKRAEKYICIFTFNIKIDENYLTRLRNAGRKGVKINIVFGTDIGEQAVVDSILSIPNCKVYFKTQMHAKFFYNEKELLVGSMNLSQASAKNNFELSVLFQGEEYLNVIAKVKEEAKEIIDDSTEWKDLLPTLERRKLKATFLANSRSSKGKGNCIRCCKSIQLNPDRPFCPSCYNEWAEWRNELYVEKYCHQCGKGKENVSFAKPQCYTCYKN